MEIFSHLSFSHKMLSFGREAGGKEQRYLKLKHWKTI